jgi:hypothetical protein
MLWCAILAGTLVGFALALALFGDLVAATASGEANLSRRSWSGHVAHTDRQ